MHKYKNLVLQGGGVKGIAYCGAFEQLAQLNVQFRNFAGSSAGSIVAGMLACGATSDFLLAEMKSADFSLFIDYGNKIKAAYNICHQMGACPGDYFSQWYGAVLEKLTQNADITLAQVHEKYGGRLVITATDIQRKKVQYFDYRTDPDLSLRLAVRMSMSIPGIFTPIAYKDTLWVDGGVLDNFPIRCFHKDTKSNDKINPKTLGLMLITTDDATPIKVNTIYTYLESLWECYTTSSQNMYLDPQDWARTIKIDCGNLSSINFSLDEAQKEHLIAQGRAAVVSYFTSAPLSQQQFILSNNSPTGYDADDDKSQPSSYETPSILDAYKK